VVDRGNDSSSLDSSSSDEENPADRESKLRTVIVPSLVLLMDKLLLIRFFPTFTGSVFLEEDSGTADADAGLDPSWRSA